MTLISLCLALLLLPASSAAESRFGEAVAALKAQPAANPEAAVISVLGYMRANLVHDPATPYQREPHAWTGHKVVEAGTFNGCVEAAKAFFELSRAAYPEFRLVYLDSFNSAGPTGGHAVVEAAGANGLTYIVDTTAFQSMPGPFRLTDNDLAQPVGFNLKYTGKVIQFKKNRLDLFATKKDGRYFIFVYPYGQVFNGPLHDKKDFGTLRELNRALGEYSAAAVDMSYLRDNRIALQYLDSDKSAFLFNEARHVIYGCYTELPNPDNATEIEPGARANYARTGKAGTCDWSLIK